MSRTQMRVMIIWKNEIIYWKSELTGILVGNFIRIAADSSSGDPRKVKKFSRKNDPSLRHGKVKCAILSRLTIAIDGAIN